MKKTIELTDAKPIGSKKTAIVQQLHRHGGAMSPHEIAKATGLSYVTVKKHLKDLMNIYAIVRVNKDGSETAGLTEVSKKRKKDKNKELRTVRGKTARYKLNYYRIFETKNN